MDPLTIQRLAHIRHQEIIAEACQDDAPTRRWLWTLGSLLALLWRRMTRLFPRTARIASQRAEIRAQNASDVC